jgi:hypothetical protein
MGQHTGQHDRRQADCGDNANPIKNVSEPFQHVRDASMPGGGTAPLQLPGTANIGMPQRSLLDRPCSPRQSPR